jgi:hypothetical protein
VASFFRLCKLVLRMRNAKSGKQIFFEDLLNRGNTRVVKKVGGFVNHNLGHC